MINKAIIAGRLTKEVNLRKTGTGNSVASFTLACNRRFTKDGEQEADFINCVSWRQSAEFLAQYAGKGDLIGVDGHIQTRSYDDQNGRKVYVTEVVSDSVCILSKVAHNAQNQAEQTSQQLRDYNEPNWNSFDGFDYREPLNLDDSDLPF